MKNLKTLTLATLLSGIASVAFAGDDKKEKDHVQKEVEKTELAMAKDAKKEEKKVTKEIIKKEKSEDKEDTKSDKKKDDTK